MRTRGKQGWSDFVFVMTMLIFLSFSAYISLSLIAGGTK